MGKYLLHYEYSSGTDKDGFDRYSSWEVENVICNSKQEAEQKLQKIKKSIYVEESYIKPIDE